MQWHRGRKRAIEARSGGGGGGGFAGRVFRVKQRDGQEAERGCKIQSSVVGFILFDVSMLIPVFGGKIWLFLLLLLFCIY